MKDRLNMRLYRQSKSQDVFKEGQAGFTLIEMAVVTLIAGLLLAAVLPLYGSYLKGKSTNETIQNLTLAQEALREFYGVYGRYPCPADPALRPGELGYGEERCRPTPADACPSVNMTCTNVLSRDANRDGTSDFVMIGALPSVTLAANKILAEFEASNGIDGFGMKISYAVTEAMADQSLSINNPANTQLGAIPVLDEQGRSVVQPADSAHYVIFSHGESALGAFSKQGQPRGGCLVVNGGNTNPPPVGFVANGIRPDLENCDNNDAIFLKGLQSLGDNNNFYDDFLFFNANTATSLWRPTNANPDFIYNTNFGNVGIGVEDPLSKLHVGTDLRAETSINSSAQFCDISQTECIPPENLGGNAMLPCPPGQAATGIENNQLICADVFSSGISFVCPNPGEFVTGFTTSGTVNCAAPQ